MEENNTNMEDQVNENVQETSENTENSVLENLTVSEGTDLEKLKSEVVEQKDKYLRLFAEFDNYKRRTSKERIELIQTAGREIISSLLEVLDDCDRAEKQIKASADHNQANEGTLLVFTKLRTILQQKGLKSMDSIHQEFDVEKHEAITEIESPDELKGKVIDELEKGYYLNEKIIRFAKVVVGK
jgi:molecular chaperone GrpE